MPASSTSDPSLDLRRSSADTPEQSPVRSSSASARRPPQRPTPRPARRPSSKGNRTSADGSAPHDGLDVRSPGVDRPLAHLRAGDRNVRGHRPAPRAREGLPTARAAESDRIWLRSARQDRDSPRRQGEHQPRRRERSGQGRRPDQMPYRRGGSPQGRGHEAAATIASVARRVASTANACQVSRADGVETRSRSGFMVSVPPCGPGRSGGKAGRVLRR